MITSLSSPAQKPATNATQTLSFDEQRKRVDKELSELSSWYGNKNLMDDESEILHLQKFKNEYKWHKRLSDYMDAIIRYFYNSRDFIIEGDTTVTYQYDKNNQYCGLEDYEKQKKASLLKPCQDARKRVAH